MKKTALLLAMIMIISLLLACGKPKTMPEYSSAEKTSDIVMDAVSSQKIVPTSLSEEEKNAQRNDLYWREKIAYSLDFDGGYDSKVGHQVGIYYVEKHIEKELVWRCALMQNTAEGERIIWNYSLGVVSDGIIVCGHADDHLKREQQASFYVAKVSFQGALLWMDELDEDYHNAGYSTLGIGIVENKDKTYTVFFCANQKDGAKQFCMVNYDQKGNVLKYAVIDNKHYYSIDRVLLYDGGYVMQLTSGIAFVDEKYRMTFVKLPGSGWGIRMFLEDIAVIDGEIYLSVGSLGADRTELNAIFDSADRVSIMRDEQLTEQIAESSVGKLLRYNRVNHTFEELYVVEGALGGKIRAAENGQFHWYVQSILSTYYSPFTNSFTYGGLCYVYRYTLDRDCKIIAEYKTGFLTSVRFL